MKSFRTKKRIFKRKNICQEFAEAIIEIFEEKLDEHNISLPDKQRKNSNLRISGRDYYDLREQIEDLIYINKNKLIKEG